MAHDACVRDAPSNTWAALRRAVERGTVGLPDSLPMPRVLWTRACAQEVRAIDSEFQQAQQNDACRVEQLIAHMSAPDHPYHRFGWGNKRSLVDLPKAAGTDMRAALVGFHGRFYSSNIMSLVIVGKESLDTLQRWISDSFGETPNRQIDRPRVTSSAAPIEPSRLPMRLTARPLEQSRQLGLGW